MPNTLNSSASESFSQRVETMGIPMGFIAPAFIQTKDKDQFTQIKALAGKVLHDPLLQRKLCDRIYELMVDDLRQQQERLRHYGGRF